MPSHPAGGDAGTPREHRLPERASPEQLRKQAKDLLRAARAGDAAALARIRSGSRAGELSRVILADAQHAIAREYGFPGWARLIRHVGAVDGFVLPPLIRPVELGSGRFWTLPDGSRAAADDVFAMFVAARAGDLAEVRRLVDAMPALARVEYNYTPPIHFAVREGHRDVTGFLLDHGADPAYRSYPFQEALLTYATDRGHAEVAELLRRRLSQRFGPVGETRSILAAAARGDLAAIETELARDPSAPLAINETGDTPLHQAARNGHLHVVRALLDAGANPDAVRGDGYRPIHCALMPNWFFQIAGGERDRIADLLLSRGARQTIFIAALRGDAQAVADAIAHDRSLAIFEDSCHHRVLSAAVRRGDPDMSRLLLEAGADPNLPEEGAPHGLSLWIAVNDGRRDLVELLLEHGADPNAAVESSGTPMTQAAKNRELAELLRAHGGREERSGQDIVGQLLEQGKLDEAERLLRANPDWLDGDWGDGILAGPAHDARHDIIALLQRLGARVPKVSKWAPFYYFKHEATAAFLLEHGMDPEHMNWHRFTLLHHMAAADEPRKAQLLLDHGAGIDRIDDEYRSTPLGVAARWGHRAMVDLLLERGADPDAAGSAWSTPLGWATRKGHDMIAAVLGAASARVT